MSNKDDTLFALLVAAGAFDDSPTGKEEPKPEGQPRRDDSNAVFLWVVMAVVVAFVLLAYVGSTIR